MESEKEATPLKPIVLKELIAEKNSKLAGRIPGFVYGLMNRLLHIREINEIIRRYGHLKGVPFIASVLQYFLPAIRVHDIRPCDQCFRH